MKSQLSSKGDALVFKTQNVIDEEGIEKVFEEIVKTEGRLDGLVCAAVFPTLEIKLMVGNNLHQGSDSKQSSVKSSTQMS